MTYSVHSPTRTEKGRFWSKVQMGPSCWVWEGARNRGGYGTFRRGSVVIKAHRAAWEFCYGPIPEGLCVLHKCDNPPCVRPDHLFLGTVADNAQDRVAKGRDGHRAKTHCPRGHPLSGENLYVCPRGKRQCRICKSEASRRFAMRRLLRVG